MADADHALYYSDDLMTNLQLRYGEGMLSPGGAEELGRLVGSIDLSGKTGLDLGCGLGGYDTLLVADYGVGRMVGVDINGAAVQLAARRAADMGMADRVSFHAVEPGPLPFEDNSFDFAFSKDSIVDIPDKAPVLAELHRVIRPGGALLISDWFRADAPYTPEMREWATTGDETYEMASLGSTAAELAAAGFAEIETEDRGEWFVAFCRDEVARLSGPLWPTYVDRFGEESARRSVKNAERRLLLAEQGQLLTGHVRARKPM
ncbi:class I SAM-dependent methyltransferase [Dichotomicrobium thermohalophilum]|uniref:Ubiquinone/menaquinone biosynthesis C-methylase UbiE n=1 Tax=Dichotomicrobium thermohalophilum TaxID=933063 RepID=A0A397QDZ0_9HYPH|nr:methyltransferase domain-containing protein [Dichotomicrobium thermohalophilum]RIA56294.1 ubiquinone/menaquinone biosynthesis C-methylase UbiE [Dichotomicrobium thermohalophilum]